MEASRSVDTLGIIARSVDDVALYRDVLVDVPPESVARASSAPRIAFCRTQYWPQLEPYAQADRCGWANSCAITMCRSPRRLPARRGLKSTGNASFSVLWTTLHVPVMTLPLLRGPHGLPVGAQLIARRDHDRKLFSIAQWATSAYARGRLIR